MLQARCVATEHGWGGGKELGRITLNSWKRGTEMSVSCPWHKQRKYKKFLNLSSGIRKSLHVLLGPMWWWLSGSWMDTSLKPLTLYVWKNEEWEVAFLDWCFSKAEQCKSINVLMCCRRSADCSPSLMLYHCSMRSRAKGLHCMVQPRAHCRSAV